MKYLVLAQNHTQVLLDTDNAIEAAALAEQTSNDELIPVLVLNTETNFVSTHLP